MSQTNLPQEAPARPPAPKLNALSVLGGTGMAAGALGLLVFGFGFFTLLLLGTGFFALLAAGLVRKSLAATDANKISGSPERGEELQRQIRKARYFENVGDLGERTAAQMEEAGERIAIFRALLGLKFDPAELAYGRYLGVAEAAFLSILDNLHLVAVSLNSLSVADARNQPEDRRVLRDTQLRKARELLALNESAITELERVSAALAEVQTRRGEGSGSLDSVMEQLKELAERAKKYSVQSIETKESSDGSESKS